MLGTENVTKAFKAYYSKYRRFIPQFISQPKYLDPYILGGFFSIFEGSDSITKLRPKFFLNTKTGWIYRIIDKRGFKKAKWFYVGYFPNKRYGKRYLFGLLPNKKVILCAIVTHVSAVPANQKHNSTKLALMKAKQLLKPDVQKLIKDHQPLQIYDMNRIDKYLFKFTSKKKIRRFKPNWLRIYQIATASKIYWKGT